MSEACVLGRVRFFKDTFLTFVTQARMRNEFETVCRNRRVRHSRASTTGERRPTVQPE